MTPAITVSIREVQHNLKKILTWVESGKTIVITNRNRKVAELKPCEKTAPPTMPNFKERLLKTFPQPIKGPSNAELLDQERNSR